MVLSTLASSLTFLTSFVIGGVFYGSLSNVFRPKRRIWVLASLASQIVLTLIASAVQYVHPEKETGVPAYVVIALLAFASAGQISLSVGLGEPSLNTVVSQQNANPWSCLKSRIIEGMTLELTRDTC